MKRILTLIALVSSSAFGYGQQTSSRNDSVRMAYLDELALKYPVLRQAFLSTDVIESAGTHSVLYGKPLYDGRIRLTRQQGNVNIPLVAWTKSSLVGSINFFNQHFDITQVRDLDQRVPVTDMHFDKATVGMALTYTLKDSLFGRPVVYTASVAGFSDVSSSARKLNYMGTVVLPLRYTAGTRLSVGLAVIVDPSTPLPVLPIFYYWHRLTAQGLEVFVDLPTRIALRQQISTHSWVSVGSMLSGNFSFFHLGESQVPSNDTYSTLELKTGPSFEYLVSRKMVLGIYGGLFSTLTSREFKQNTNPNDYFIRNNNHSAPYINFTLSFLPFFRTRK